MFFSKKKKRKRFLCLRILCFFGIKGDYSVPQTVMSNYLNTTICFDLYDWHAQKIQKLSNSTPRTNGHRPKGKVKGVPGTLVQNTKDSAAIPTIRDPPRISYPILYEAKVPWHQQRP